jgi:hypothetical protein
MAEPQNPPDDSAEKPEPAKAPAKKAVKKAAAKKAPAKKAVAKKAPAKKVPPPPAPPPSPAPPPPAVVAADTNGSRQSTIGARETAAQAKSTVAAADIPIIPQMPSPTNSRMPVAAAVVAGVLAILVVLLARRGSDD